MTGRDSRLAPPAQNLRSAEGDLLLLRILRVDHSGSRQAVQTKINPLDVG